jgi:hypothetical protein
MELTSKGYNQREIGNMLQVAHSTVGADQLYLRQKARENLKNYIDERKPDEYERTLTGLRIILREPL